MNFKKLDQEQIKAYQKAVNLHSEILWKFQELWGVNRPMAWGLLHELDTIAEFNFSRVLRKANPEAKP